MFKATGSRNNYLINHHLYYTTHFFNGINKIWIKFLFVTLIFALVQTSTPSTLAPIQKRGELLLLFANCETHDPKCIYLDDSFFFSVHFIYLFIYVVYLFAIHNLPTTNKQTNNQATTKSVAKILIILLNILNLCNNNKKL